MKESKPRKKKRNRTKKENFKKEKKKSVPWHETEKLRLQINWE